MSDRRLAEFLRARRALVRPEDHGLAPGGDRRTPGLRRDEVAMLAGVSTDYYSRLEQGREVRPSAQVLDALAGALLLEDEAAAHLRGLVGTPRPRRRASRRERLHPSMASLMDRWSDTPALALGRHQDVLGANALGAALFEWLGDETNLLRALFLNPAARDFYRTWDRVAENCVASLRAASGGVPDDPRLVELVGELSIASPEFARLWARHEVRSKTREAKLFRHPRVGDLTLGYEVLTVNSAPGQQLVVYQAEPGSPSEESLRLLGSLSAPPAQPRQPH
ncbi:XRE family transcriptional regulator [Actinomadura logoneensis]|uniref:XRE family transcriptional regulator n=1 Tax=Actinomadura logoneensis TaxID=2293572 RepID=A0A372JP85_9ACTN|nr:helix-turn-helix transcriptional regulator [Actinomadura logoneensis]RFU41769.1 XRE family transcriptional regulator [Actinomadura logoneensis]